MLLLVSVLILLCGVGTYVEASRALDLRLHGIRVSGHVTQPPPRPYTYTDSTGHDKTGSAQEHLIIGYRDGSGTNYSIDGVPMVGPLASHPPKAGDEMQIVYLARAPGEGVLDIWSELWLLPFVLGLFTCGLLAVLLPVGDFVGPTTLHSRRELRLKTSGIPAVATVLLASPGASMLRYQIGKDPRSPAAELSDFEGVEREFSGWKPTRSEAHIKRGDQFRAYVDARKPSQIFYADFSDRIGFDASAQSWKERAAKGRAESEQSGDDDEEGKEEDEEEATVAPQRRVVAPEAASSTGVATESRMVQLVPFDAVPPRAVRRYRVPYAWPVFKVVAITALVVWCVHDIREYLWLSFFHGTPALVIFGGLSFITALRDVRAVLSPAAWVAVLDTDGVYVNARSYRNAHRDGEPVVFLPLRDIRSVREMRKTWTWRRMRGGNLFNNIASVDCADLEIDPAVSLKPLQSALVTERLAEFEVASQNNRSEMRAPGTRLMPDIVSIASGNVVRVEWSASPNLADFLRRIPVKKGVAGSVESTIQESTARGASGVDIDAVARRGNVIELTLAIRAFDGCTLNVARKKAEFMIANR